MLFVGLDLAWSTKNGSGIAVVDGDGKRAKLVSYGLVYSDEEIINYISKSVGKENALIAIDAPLIVPNEKGRRIAEVIVGDLFRKYDAGAHPANRSHLASFYGKIRGEVVSELLKKNGFAHSPYLAKHEQTRKFFEVYPHPSMVVLFGLNRIIRYKAKPNREYEDRYAAFREYQKHMAALAKADLPISLPKELTKQKMEELKAQSLKDYEDKLDGVFCAYIAYYAWANPTMCAVLGSLDEGYILTPITDSMRRQLEAPKSQKKL